MPDVKIPISYRLVVGGDTHEFRKECEEWINEGYHPLGGVQMTEEEGSWSFAQAFVFWEPNHLGFPNACPHTRYFETEDANENKVFCCVNCRHTLNRPTK